MEAGYYSSHYSANCGCTLVMASASNTAGEIYDRYIRPFDRNTAAENQTISAHTEEQSASMQEMAASSQRLADMAHFLEDGVRKIKV